ASAPTSAPRPAASRTCCCSAARRACTRWTWGGGCCTGSSGRTSGWCRWSGSTRANWRRSRSRCRWSPWTCRSSVLRRCCRGRRAAPAAELVVLVKPQSEVGRAEVGKGGVVRDDAAVARALQRFRDWCGEHGLRVLGETWSALPGADGNRELLLHLEPAA